jgi:hypothetical protein
MRINRVDIKAIDIYPAEYYEVKLNSLMSIYSQRIERPRYSAYYNLIY